MDPFDEALLYIIRDAINVRHDNVPQTQMFDAWKEMQTLEEKMVETIVHQQGTSSTTEEQLDFDCLFEEFNTQPVDLDSLLSSISSTKR